MLSSFLVYAAFGYIAIAFTCHMAYCWQNPQDIELKKFDRKLAAPAAVVELLLLLPPAKDVIIPDTLQTVAFETREVEAPEIAPGLAIVVHSALQDYNGCSGVIEQRSGVACEVKLEDGDRVWELTKRVEPSEPDAPIDLSSMTSAELRKVCSDRGIRWRSVKQGKHLSKPEMLAALS